MSYTGIILTSRLLPALSSGIFTMCQQLPGDFIKLGASSSFPYSYIFSPSSHTSAMVCVVLNKIDLGSSKSSGRAIFSDLISPSVSFFVSNLIVSQSNFSLAVLWLNIQPEKPIANNPNTNRVIHSFFSIFIVSPYYIK